MDKQNKPASNDALAEEARLWDSGALSPAGWRDAPDAIPRNADSATVSARISRRADERAIEERANMEDAAAPRAE